MNTPITNWADTSPENLLYVYGEEGLEEIIDLTAPLPPKDYTEEVDIVAADEFVYSLQWAGALE